MNARASTFTLLGGLLILGAVTVTWRHHSTTAPAPRAEPTSQSLPAPRVELSGDYVEHDPAIVFQRAFWRYLGPDVQVRGVDLATELQILSFYQQRSIGVRSGAGVPLGTLAILDHEAVG